MQTMQHFMASNGHSSSGATNGFRAGSMEDLKLPPQRKSQNMTECVPVPTSEHVAEIVGRQGKAHIPNWAEISNCRYWCWPKISQCARSYPRWTSNQRLAYKLGSRFFTKFKNSRTPSNKEIRSKCSKNSFFRPIVREKVRNFLIKIIHVCIKSSKIVKKNPSTFQHKVYASCCSVCFNGILTANQKVNR